ncbi:MAG: HEAT repeat domain-containing protein [Myxococcales bacterium]|nr:HEAT repeat domain-containing protein [Myxococcales bacterium]MCA9558087.1 HEAT repeat domain-containing protein [Myxococcales bacterium]MCB9523660.1 HEAT repeat domain-containing protein [Myxococcales bacterium]
MRATEENGISVEDAQRLEENEGGCLNEDVAAFKSIRTMTEEFPWGSERWNGTGHPDPGPLRAVTNAEMLRRAAEAVGPDREHALVSIGRRRLPEALDVIARAQFHDQPQAVREMALSALIEHGGPDALPLMWRAVTDPSEYVRGMAVWAIALYGHAEAVKAIQAALDDQHAYVVGMGILATTALRDEADFWPIMDRVIGSDEQVIFQEAAYVLSQIDSEFARDYLRREYDRSKDNRRATFRFYLRESLRKRLY